MNKLFDIKGYFDSSYEYQFNDRDMWKGKFLLDDDGWFEGIVVTSSGFSYNNDRFIFGVYCPGKAIELFELTSTGNSPFIYHGIRDVKGYDGEFGVESESIGVSRIITQEAEKIREVSNSEVNQVKLRIDRYKSLLMDDVSRKFYDDNFSLKSCMSKNIIDTYNEKRNSKSVINECCFVKKN